MRILRVIHSVNPAGGGPIQGIRSITPAIDKLGVKTDILCLDPPDAPWLSDFQIPVHAVGPGLKGYGYTPRLMRWFRECATPYDAVMIHGLWLYASFGTWAALRTTLPARRAPPYFVLPHGMLDPWFQHSRPLKAIRNTIYWKLFEHRVIRDAEAVLFTSDEERRLARDSFVPYRCREKVIAYGAAVPAGDRESQKRLFIDSFPELRGKRVLLFLSRLHEKKGIDLLIRAFAHVQSALSAGLGFPASRLRPQVSDLHLVLAGPCADPRYLEYLKKLAEECFAEKLPETKRGRLPITWTGMLGGDMKWGAFHAADAFVLPSHQENFGIAVAEALACGVPVLISDKVNIWREIKEDRAGLVESDDLDGTARLLNGWLTMEPESQRAMGAAALRCFTSRFEISRAAEHLIELLKSNGCQDGEGDAAQLPIALRAGTIRGKG